MSEPSGVGRRAPRAWGGLAVLMAALATAGPVAETGPTRSGPPSPKPDGAASAPAKPRAQQPPARPSAEAVARVNGKPVLRSDFDLAVQMQFSGRRPASVGLEELRAVREKVLDRLIDGELLYQAAARSGASVPDGDVDAELARIRERLGNPRAFERTLKDGQVTEAQFREQLRRSLLTTRFVDKEVAGDLKIADEDVRRYYDQNPEEMKRREAVRLSEITVRVAPGASARARADARLKIEAILKELRSGGDFADLARRYSQGPEAARGGDAGWMPRGGGPPPIERAAFSLETGDVSDVIDTRLGLHIIKVGEHRPEGVIPFDEAKASIREKLLARERDEKIQEFIGGLRQTAHIERLLPKEPAKTR